VNGRRRKSSSSAFSTGPGGLSERLDERLYERAIQRLARRERSLSEMRDFLEGLVERDGGQVATEVDASGASANDSGTSAAELIEQVLQKLVALRYLDEERMAAAIIRDQRLQSRGPRSAWMKLRQRGVSGWSLERVEAAWRSAEESFFSAPRDEKASAEASAESSEPADAADSRAAGLEAEVETARRWVRRRYRGLGGSAGDESPGGQSDRSARDELYREKQRALGALLRRGYSMAVARKAIDG
jgi:SOS response regulatory protein OraA/RecX